MNAYWVSLGTVKYNEAKDIQLKLVEKVKEGFPDTLLVVEHPPVLTLGAKFQQSNLLFSRADYESRGIDVEVTDRGGDVTYHGPGQLVLYPIYNLQNYRKDLHWWLRQLEETMVVTCDRFGLRGERSEVNTGVWIKGRKVAAIGIKVSRWVNFHGIALNCNADLSPFSMIVPCGLVGYGVTSLSAELGRIVTVEEAKQVALASFQEVFGLSMEELPKEELMEELNGGFSSL